MNQRNQYDYRGARQGRRPDDEFARNQARGERFDRWFEGDAPRYTGSRQDFDEMSEYDIGDRGRMYAADQDDAQYLGGYPTERGAQYYNAPRAQGPQRYPQYGQLRGGRDYSGAYGPEDFRQGSHLQGPSHRPQRNYAGASPNESGSAYTPGNFRGQRYQPGYSQGMGGYARDFDEGDYDQAYGGYSPSQRGYAQGWSGYGRGSYGPAYGQGYEQDLMGTTNATVGSGNFNQGPANYERHGYGQGTYAGGYSQGLAGRGGFTGQSFSPHSEYDYAMGRESHFGKGPKGYVRSDERLKEDISERLLRDHEIDASDISVEAKNGNVTLSGSVNDRRLKHYVEDVIEQCTGVKEIDNRLTVRARNNEGARSASTKTPGSGSLGGSTGEEGNATRKN